MLTLRDRPALADRYGLADAARVACVMRKILFAAADVLTNARMLDITRHHDRDSVAHLVGNHNTAKRAAFRILLFLERNHIVTKKNLES